MSQNLSPAAVVIGTLRVNIDASKYIVKISIQGFFQQFWEKAPGQNGGKMIDLTSKLGEINNIEHNKGSKIYPQNQVILDFILPSIILKYNCLSIIRIWSLFPISRSL